jgi:hypothetical protein
MKPLTTEDVLVPAPKPTATDLQELRIQSFGRHFMTPAAGTGGQFCICSAHAGHRIHKTPKGATR